MGDLTDSKRSRSETPPSREPIEDFLGQLDAVFPALDRSLDTASALAFRSTCRAADRAWTAARGRIHRTQCRDAVRHGPAFFAWILGGPESGSLYLTMECSDWAVSRLLEATLELPCETNPVLDVLWECDAIPNSQHVRAAARSGCIDRLLRAIELYDRWLTDHPTTDDIGRRTLRGAFHAACEAAHPDVSSEVMTAVRKHYPELVPTPTQPPSQDRDRREMYAAFARAWLDLTLIDWLWRPDGTLIKYGNTEPEEDQRFCPRMFPWDAAIPPEKDVSALEHVLANTDFRNVMMYEAKWSPFLESCARRVEWGAREMHRMAVATETWYDPENDPYGWENWVSPYDHETPTVDDGPVRAALACGLKELSEELLEMAVGLETRLREDCLKKDPTADFEYPTVRGPFASCFVAASRKDPSLYPTLRRLFSEEEIREAEREAERRLQPSMHTALVGGDWDAVRKLRAAGNDWSYRDWWDAVRAGASIERLRRMLADGLPAKRSFFLSDLYGMQRTVARLL